MPITILKPAKPQQYVAISLISVYLSKQVDLLDYYRKKAEEMPKADQSKPSESIALFGIGMYDICVINAGSGLQSLFELQDIPLREGTQHQRYYYGRVIGYSGEFNFKKMVLEKPLAGISFVKLKKELLIYFRKEPEEFYSLITRKIIQVSKEVDTIVCLGFGVEDFIILYFGDSFEAIKRSVCKFRNLSTKKVFPQSTDFKKEFNIFRKIRHIVSATYTIPLIYVFPMGRKRYTVDLHKIKNHKVLGYIQTQLLPGHLGYVRSALNIKNKSKNFFTTMGKNDIIIFPEKSTQLINFLGKYINIFDKLWRKPAPAFQTPVMSMETTLGIKFNRIPEGKEPSKVLQFLKERPIYNKKRRTENWFFDSIEKAKCLPEYTGKAISTMLQDMKMLLRTSVVNDSVISLYEAYKTFANKISSECKKSHEDVQMEIPFPTTYSFHDETSMLLDSLYLCFLHRYPGEFAVGEQSTSPVTTYKTGLQQYLNIVDYICTTVYEISCELTKKKRNTLANIKPCCYLGNSPSPWIQVFKYFPIVIINIPTQCLYDIPTWLHFIGHEIGHIYVDQWDLQTLYSLIDKKVYSWANQKRKKSKKSSDRLAKETKVIVRECLADFYECQLLLNGNIKRYQKLSSELSIKILGDSQATLDVHELRIVILEIMKQASEDIKPIVNREGLNRIYIEHDLSAEMQELCDEIVSVLIQVLRKRKNNTLLQLFLTLKEFPELLKKQRNSKASFVKSFSGFLLEPINHDDWQRKYSFCSFLTRTHREALQKFFPKSLLVH